MKTPRQILFDRHQDATPTLDALREAALSELAGQGRARSPSAPLANRIHTSANGALGERALPPVRGERAQLQIARTGLADIFLSVLRSFRWHIAALSAAWLVVLFLNSEPSSSTAPPAMAQQNPRTDLLASLRENRRQILELLGQAASAPKDDVPAVTPPRRSQRQSENPFVYV